MQQFNSSSIDSAMRIYNNQIQLRRIQCLLQYLLFLSQMQLVQTINKRSGRPRYDHILNKTREQRFNNRSSLNQKLKNYDALSDPYTSYYFANKSVKDHLKQLKKALKYEPNFTERSKINKLLTLRIKEKFQDVICPKTSVYQQSLSEHQLRNINQKSRSSFSNQRLDNYFTNRDNNNTPFVLPENLNAKPETNRKQSEKLPKIKVQNGKLIKQFETEQAKIESHQSIEKQKAKKKLPKGNEQKIIANKLAQQLHLKKHQKWITFLQQKKKMLINKKNHAESPKKQQKDHNNESQSDHTPIPSPQPHPSRQ